MTRTERLLALARSRGDRAGELILEARLVTEQRYAGRGAAA